MQFVNMDVDRFGSRDRFQLGTFSLGLNAICGPRGSGKTQLVKWLRSMFAGNGSGELARLDGFDAASGSVELRLGDDRIRLHAHDFSSANESRAFYNDSSAERQLSAIQRRALVGSLSVPSDSAAIGRLEDLAKQLGLDGELWESRSTDQTHLAGRERELLNQLQRLDGLASNRDALIARQQQLGSELDRLRHLDTQRSHEDTSHRRQRLEQQSLAMEADIRTNSLQIEELDRSVAKCQSEIESLSVGLGHSELLGRIATSFRERMAQLDGQLHRWRQTLSELRAYRDRLNQSATDARLDQQIGDQLSSVRQPDPRAALRVLESQIINTRRQLDDLLGHYEHHLNEGSGDVHAVLPETLRNMQKSLYEVCQQLSLHESLATRDSLSEQSSQFERCESELLCAIEKLIGQRGELLQAIADEYHVSREQIALAFGDWCQCEDHPHLADWLHTEKSMVSQIHPAVDSQTRHRLQDELQCLEEDRRRATARLDDARQRLRELQNQLRLLVDIRPTAPAGRHESEIYCDLDRVASELREIESRDRLRIELEEVRRQLHSAVSVQSAKSSFHSAVDRHLVALSNRRYDNRRELGYNLAQRKVERPYIHDSVSAMSDLAEHRQPIRPARYVERDFTVPRLPESNFTGHHSSVTPAAIIETAMRLAIAECLADRGHAIPVVLDSTLDHLHSGLRETAVRYLAQIAGQRAQQVVLLTGEQHLANLVRDLRGNVIGLNVAQPAVRETLDVNRQLAAYANDHEAEKWSKPDPFESIRVPEERRESQPGSRFFLTESSTIDKLASIDTASAAKMRALGVDRIGELLNADPNWLADNIQLPGVTESIVRFWQAEASLLCSVPQLRPFDARVLVGAGIRHPQQLAQMRPSRLLERVEKFLTTDRGQDILRSGNSYELSRISTWIASAKNGAPQYRRSNFDDADQQTQSTMRTPGRNSDSLRRQRAVGAAPAYAVGDQQPTKTTDGPRLVPRSEREVRSRRDRPERDSVNSAQRSSRRSNRLAAERKGNANNEARWKFYLDLSSTVADAPAIGPRMAERLAGRGIKTVQQLLAANAESLAEGLALKQVSADTVRAWQDQARLVCRIPNLRGHDAQLLVSTGINSPEDLANMQPEVVLQQVMTVARTAEGQRIIRGGKQPDLAEVTDWINWAGHSRSIQAA